MASLVDGQGKNKGRREGRVQGRRIVLRCSGEFGIMPSRFLISANESFHPLFGTPFSADVSGDAADTWHPCHQNWNMLEIKQHAILNSRPVVQIYLSYA